eukprot:comp97773_c0_seq1/m.48677 comp97773_c0_seq1/g.48677  ORF comp97773_c0_seq1/g.48677 comp97773_c0_seq1/m.48677 type:complete len:417 (-) comp97773_c0_seq1:265-1515(-)
MQMQMATAVVAAASITAASPTFFSLLMQPVVPLDQSNFAAETGTPNHVLVAFTKSTGTCDEYKDTPGKNTRCDLINDPPKALTDYATPLHEFDIPLALSTVDCKKEANLCATNEVTSNPQLAIYSQGSLLSTYSGTDYGESSVSQWLFDSIPMVPQPTDTHTPQACFEGCEVCDPEMDFRCKKCKEGYGQADPFMASCDPCSDGCINCNNEDLSCYECREGYERYRNEEDEYFYCRKANSTAGQQKNRRRDSRCGFHCVRCDTSMYDRPCRKCEDGWGVSDTMQKDCQRCGVGCRSCSNEDLSCYVCFDGYVRVRQTEDMFVCVKDNSTALGQPYVGELRTKSVTLISGNQQLSQPHSSIPPIVMVISAFVITTTLAIAVSLLRSPKAFHSSLSQRESDTTVTVLKESGEKGKSDG